MRCQACGYDTSGGDPEYYGPPGEQFIELTVVERGPFFSSTPYDWPTGKAGSQAVMRGTPTKMLACPNCGTVKIEVQNGN